ncbi:MULTISPECIES: sulfatase-like hydrolase/transferase [Mesorhizobium]|uniref:DUF229 domain-containing protein n=1 Tax=Mesorhizobium denitrificans TaxID=2294114 RepID=A0A371XCT0_9HYPH|nr:MULTISPECIES: sulfatase-like hydrolase/transferase [Mesorhizobium]RFC67003.1 DUF229 domain-containing protein [Mesorhizobium denitrificans]
MQPRRPNILIFMTDQQNASTIADGSGCRARTPHLDRFRDRAVTFSKAFAPSPHCCPSRASFFTGTLPSEHGVWNNVNVANALSRGPRPGIPFWSRALAEAGYDMGFAGKWHVSNSTGPSAFGWSELTTPSVPGAGLDLDAQRAEARRRELTRLAERPDSEATVRVRGEIQRPGWPRYLHYGIDEDPFGDRDVVERGVDFIRSRLSEQPWCLYVGTLGPHDPYMPPRRFLDLYDREKIFLPANFDDPMADKPALYRRTRARFDQLSREEQRDALLHYMAFCSYEDELFGKLLAALDDTGQTEDTIVVFLSDHGDYAGEHGLWGKGLPCFQSAYAIPLVIGGRSLDATLAGTNCDCPITLADLGPTLCDLAGSVKAERMTGRSFGPWLAGLARCPEPQPVFFQSNGNEVYGIQRIVVSGAWKLVYNAFDYDELYNLADDPGETRNLIASAPIRKVGAGPLDHVPSEFRDIVRDLYRQIWDFAIAHQDDIFDPYILTAMGTFGPQPAARFAIAGES